MTDHRSVPLLHPRSEPVNAPDTGQELSPAVDSLLGRMLIQVAPARADAVRGQLDTGRSGLVLCGSGALKKAAALRERDGFGGALLVDPAAYETSAASENDPFPHIDSGTFAFDDPLEVSLAEQRAAKVTAPLTPTGYIHAERSDVLHTAVQRVKALNDPAVIFTVPIDVAWLGDEESVNQLIAYLRLVDGAKAIMLGGQMDPLARFAHAVANLRRVITEVPGAALLRSDLAAFGALAHGAAFTAFGSGSRLRHIVPPDEKAKTTKGFAQSPHVLFPELMDFFLGATLAKRFAVVEAPRCSCAACAGQRALDVFSSNRGTLSADAAAHNIAVLMEWLRTLHAVTPGTQRQVWWHERCRHATEQYPLVNAMIEQAGAFKVPEQLKRWAATPPATPTNRSATPAEAQRTR